MQERKTEFLDTRNTSLCSNERKSLSKKSEKKCNDFMMTMTIRMLLQRIYNLALAFYWELIYVFSKCVRTIIKLQQIAFYLLTLFMLFILSNIGSKARVS